MDPLIKLTCMLDTYRRLYERARKLACMDSEYGYRESSEFYLGQQFVLESLIEELEALRALLEVTNDA